MIYGDPGVHVWDQTKTVSQLEKKVEQEHVLQHLPKAKRITFIALEPQLKQFGAKYNAKVRKTIIVALHNRF